MDRALTELNSTLVIAAFASVLVFIVVLLFGRRAKQAAQGSGIDWATEERRMQQIVALRKAAKGEPRMASTLAGAPAPPPHARKMAVEPAEPEPPQAAGGEDLARIIGGLHD